MHWISTAKKCMNLLAVVIFREIRRSRNTLSFFLSLSCIFQIAYSGQVLLISRDGVVAKEVLKTAQYGLLRWIPPPARMLPCLAWVKEPVFYVASMSWRAFWGVMAQIRTLPPDWYEEHFLGYSNQPKALASRLHCASTLSTRSERPYQKPCKSLHWFSQQIWINSLLWSGLCLFP